MGRRPWQGPSPGVTPSPRPRDLGPPGSAGGVAGRHLPIGNLGGMAGRLPAAARRRQLLDVALGEFAERGYSGVSMDQVAEAAGVTKPVLYQHFTSKRALYLELVADVADRLESAVVKAT